MLEHHNTTSSCRRCKRLNISDLFSSGAQTLSEKLKFGVKKLEKSTSDQALRWQKCIIYSRIIIIRYGVFALQSKLWKSVSFYSCMLMHNYTGILILQATYIIPWCYIYDTQNLQSNAVLKFERFLLLCTNRFSVLYKW
jgi:hypothetical protein